MAFWRLQSIKIRAHHLVLLLQVLLTADRRRKVRHVEWVYSRDTTPYSPIFRLHLVSIKALG